MLGEFPFDHMEYVFLMQLIKRLYQPGDEIDINKLYKLITKRNRSMEEYRWEWIDTWKGQGSMWLAFDEDREKDDQLVMQYSLIPTPFSVWGESYPAGKTENCMSHPDLRGKGLYFPHEQQSFEEAKKRFQIFFTTAGDVAKGAAGAVRRKLGYVAFDSWAYYVFLINKDYLNNLLFSRLKNFRRIPLFISRTLSAALSTLFSYYFKMHFPPKPVGDFRVFGKNDAPMQEIEDLWEQNKTYYGITVDRKSRYLKWRINQNPYFDYVYVLNYKENRLVGYAIISLNHNNAFLIEDILAEKSDMSIFDEIISYLIWYAKDAGVAAVSCGTLEGNAILKSIFARNKFVDVEAFRSRITRKERSKEFHVFFSPEIKCKQNPLDPQNWYITNLVSEGRS